MNANTQALPDSGGEVLKHEPSVQSHPLFKRLNYTAPSSDFLGRTLLSVDDATKSVRLRYHARPECANIRGDVQGGFVAAMLDSASGCALVAALPRHSFGVTLDMNISYISPTPLGELHGYGRLIHMGGTVAFVEGELRAPSGELTARCTASLRIVHGKPRQREEAGSDSATIKTPGAA